MCGISFIATTGDSLTLNVIDAMTDVVAHRGPDGHGRVLLGEGPDGYRELGASQRGRVALGHRRLSILDLSERGHQPMRRGQNWLTYNGEVYNYVELRRNLAATGRRFDSETDTEVLLEALRAWGPEVLSRLRGMWGFVWVDGSERKAYLARDHIGIKPLYIAWVGGRLAAASEIKQFGRIPWFDLRAREEAVDDYIASGFEDPLRTLFADIDPVPAGHWLELDLTSLRVSSPLPFWHPERIVVSVVDVDDAAEAFADRFTESIDLHRRSDVPVGCALSGGVDSSAVALALQRARRRDTSPPSEFHTFSIVFPGYEKDESPFIREVNEFLDARSHTATPTPEGLWSELDHFVWSHDEPTGSFAQYSAFVLARLTREADVPVTLNGQGGDEILGGYWQMYFAHLSDMARQRNIRGLASTVLRMLGPSGNPALLSQVGTIGRRTLARLRPTTTVRLRRPTGSSQRGRGRLAAYLGKSTTARRLHEVRSLTLPRLLKWDDRAFMAFSVEGRYPFLDPELIDMALSFAPETTFVGGWTKEPIRRGLRDILPPSIARRRSKFGFESPTGAWLAGPLHARVRDRLLDRSSPVQAYVEPAELETLLRRVRAGKGLDTDLALYRVFMADAWLRVFMTDGFSPPARRRLR